MDKYIFDKKNGLWYELQGDYYIPCLSYTINIQHLLSLVKLLNPRRIHRNVRL